LAMGSRRLAPALCALPAVVEVVEDAAASQAATGMLTYFSFAERDVWERGRSHWDRPAGICPAAAG
jgi:hypothetical protein